MDSGRGPRVLCIVKCHPTQGQSIQKFLHKCFSPEILATSSGQDAQTGLDTGWLRGWAQPERSHVTCQGLQGLVSDVKTQEEWYRMGIPEIREQGILSGILIPVLSVGHLSQEEKSILNCLLHKHMSYQLPRLDPVMCYRSCIPPLPPCVENLQVSMRETHRRGRRSNITSPCGRGEDTAPRRRITAQVGAGIKLTRV